MSKQDHTTGVSPGEIHVHEDNKSFQPVTTKTEGVELPDLSDEQMALIEERVRRKILLEEGSKKDEGPQAKAPEAAKDPNEGWFTNATNSEVMIDDLGMKAGDRFMPESFQPFEQKHLRRYYTRKEIDRSKYLLKAIDMGLIKPGRIPKDQLQGDESPLAKITRSNAGTEAQFHDPTSAGRKGEFGSSTYDKKLKELAEKDHQEDIETRAGGMGQ